MKLSVALAVLMGILVLACSSDTQNLIPKTGDISKDEVEIIDGITNPNSVVEESTVRITISTANDESVSYTHLTLPTKA